jgi:hypothetical protein
MHVFFLGFYDYPVRRYELKQDDKKFFFLQICTFLFSVKGLFLINVSAFVLVKIKQSLILKNYSSKVVVFIQNSVK